MKIQKLNPHGPLEELAPGLWRVVGSIRRSPLPRTMVVYRLRGGGLWIHSGVAMNEQGMAALEALGTPTYLVVPNSLHRLDAPFYKHRYPGLRILCPAALRGRIERVVPVDGLAEEELSPWGIVCHAPDGVKNGELVYELPLDHGRALVMADLLFNLPNRPGPAGWLVRAIGSSGFFGMTRIGRGFMLRDAGAFIDWLLRMAETPGLQWILVAHGDAAGENAPGLLREAARRLES